MFPPQPCVASLRTHGFARAWSKAGCRVTVLTTAKQPDQSGLNLPVDDLEVVEIPFQIPFLLNRLRRDHKQAAATPAAGGRRFRWLGTLQRLKARTGIFSAVRMPDLTDYWVRPALAWARAQGPRWDVVVSSAGPYTAHRLARMVKRVGLAPYWAADYRDLWTENHLYSGLFPFTLAECREEQKCWRDMDLAVTVSEELANRLRMRTRSRVEVIYNGWDPEMFAGLDPTPFFPPDGLCRLVYTGSYFPPHQDPEPLLRGLRQLRSNSKLEGRLTLEVAGWSVPLWRAAAECHGVSDLLRTHGLVAHAEALRMQRDAAALIVLDWRDPNQGVLTGKIFEYLRATPPILAVGGDSQSALARLLEQTRRGTHLGVDSDCVARVLLHLLEDSRSLDRPVNQAFLAQLARPVQSLHFLEHIRRLIGQPPSTRTGRRAVA
jgi:hypothetical protein